MYEGRFLITTTTLLVRVLEALTVEIKNFNTNTRFLLIRIQQWFDIGRRIVK